MDALIRIFVKFDQYSMEVKDLAELKRVQRRAKRHNQVIRGVVAICYEQSEELFGEEKLIATKVIG